MSYCNLLHSILQLLTTKTNHKSHSKSHSISSMKAATCVWYSSLTLIEEVLTEEEESEIHQVSLPL